MGSGNTLDYVQPALRGSTISRRQVMARSVGVATGLTLGSGVGLAGGLLPHGLAQEAQVGGTLYYGLSSDPPNLDPYIASGASAEVVKLQIYNSLLQFTEKGGIEADLADSWEVSEDGLGYSFTLKSGVEFHNGEILSANDVKASLDRILADDSSASRKAELQTITEIEITGDLSFILKLDRPNSALLDYLALPETSILSRKFLEEGGDPAHSMVGTGAYRLSSIEPGVQIEVERNDNFFRDGLPYLDRVVFIPYPDENTRVAAIQSGEIHAAEYIPWKDMDALDSNEDVSLRLDEQVTAMALMFNVQRPPYDNPEARRALAYAFDRQAITDAVFFGRAEPITGGIIPRSYWAHDEGLEGTFGFDPDEAQRLLTEAGFGEDTTVRLLSSSQYGMYQSTGEICQKNLQDLGLNCELELVDWATQLERLGAGEFDVQVFAITFYISDPDDLSNFFQSGARYPRGTGFANEEIDQLLADGRSELDQENRKSIYSELESRLLELSPIIYLTWREQGMALETSVQGWTQLPSGLSYHSARTLERVWIDE